MQVNDQVGSVEVLIQEKIGMITFSHPSHNALPSYLLDALVKAFEQLGTAQNVEVIILKSGGDRTFCAGASFDELVSIQDLEVGRKFFLGFANVINAIRTCPKLVIGQIQGKAVGGGVGLASAVDYCLATKYAAIKLSELAIGIGPFVIEPAVSRKIGLTAMSQMALNPTAWKSAEWALEKGLYAAVFEDQVQLNQAVLQFANELSSYNPEAKEQLKKVLWEGTQDWNNLLAKRADISGKLVLSAFTKAALKRFQKS